VFDFSKEIAIFLDVNTKETVEKKTICCIENMFSIVRLKSKYFATCTFHFTTLDTATGSQQVR
jgi:hypothetical protein